MMTQNTDRYLVLDGLRGIAAISIMLYHYGLSAHIELAVNATLGVDLFFMLSGFILTMTYEPRFQQGYTYSAYIQRVLLRLYPMFLAGCAIGTLALFLEQSAGFISATHQEIVTASISNAFLLPYLNLNNPAPQICKFAEDIQPVFPTNHAAWSLFFQLIGNFLLLPLLTLRTKNLLQIISISLVVLIWLGYLYATSTSDIISITPSLGWDTLNFVGGLPRLMFSFTLGVLLQRLLANKDTKSLLQNNRFYRECCKIPLLTYQLAIGLFCLSTNALRGFFAELSLLACPFIILLGAGSTHTSKTMRNIAVFLGWISYPLYCVHMPVGWLVDYAYKTKLPPPELASLPPPLLSSLTSMLVTIILIKIYEEPVRTLLTPKKRA